MDELLLEEVISESDKEHVRAENIKRGAIAASFLLIEKLPRKHVDWYRLFLEVARRREMYDIVELLDVPISKSNCFKDGK